MNFSLYSSPRSENECNGFLLKALPMRYSSADSFYGLFIAAAVFNLATCPFTIFLNALVMIVVKTKRRLQKHPNILLACLALTDLMVGLVLQPLNTAMTIFLLQGKNGHEFCDIHFAFSISFAIFIFATASHLILISGERYLAIKHTFKHATVVTKARLMIFSAMVWITAPLYFIGTLYLTAVRFVYHAALISSIVSFQVLVYKEARRHEKMILSLQVSVEARAKFRQEKRALKLTSIILAKTFLCFFLPSISVIIAFRLFRDQFSPELELLVAYICRLLVISSSVLNPVIYTVRKRQFRVACIELLLRKSLQDAEEFDRRLFGPRTNAARPQNGQEGEEREANTEKRNEAHANDNLEDNPEVLASVGYCEVNSFPALQDEPFSSNELTRPSELTREEHDEEGNLAHDNNKQEDNPEVLASGAYCHENSFPLQEEPFSLNELTRPSAREEHDEERDSAHDKSKQEDTPKLLTPGLNPDANTCTFTLPNEPSSNAHTH